MINLIESAVAGWLLKETRGALELCGQKKARELTLDYVLVEKNYK